MSKNVFPQEPQLHHVPKWHGVFLGTENPTFHLLFWGWKPSSRKSTSVVLGKPRCWNPMWVSLVTKARFTRLATETSRTTMAWTVNVEEVGCGFAADFREADVWAEVQPKLGRWRTGELGLGCCHTATHLFFLALLNQLWTYTICMDVHLQDLTISLHFYWCTWSRTTKTRMICRGLRPKIYFIVGNICPETEGARWAPGWCSNVAP